MHQRYESFLIVPTRLYRLFPSFYRVRDQAPNRQPQARPKTKENPIAEGFGKKSKRVHLLNVLILVVPTRLYRLFPLFYRVRGQAPDRVHQARPKTKENPIAEAFGKNN